MYAIIHSGGKQYPVKEGDVIDVDLLKQEAGSQIEFQEVLFFNDGKKCEVGAPHVEKCKVKGELVGVVKGPKVIAFKYKRRKSCHRKVGHRQKYSRVKITGIEMAGAA